MPSVLSSSPTSRMGSWDRWDTWAGTEPCHSYVLLWLAMSPVLSFLCGAVNMSVRTEVFQKSLNMMFLLNTLGINSEMKHFALRGKEMHAG